MNIIKRIKKNERNNEEIIFKRDKEMIESPLKSVTEKVDMQKTKVTIHSSNRIKIRRDCRRCSKVLPLYVTLNLKLFYMDKVVDTHFGQKVQWQKKPNNKEDERKNEYKW